MATYNNKHWLLSHIRNSFISTDDTGMCESVMLSDDLPNQYILLNRNNNINAKGASTSTTSSAPPTPGTSYDENDYLCYPGLDQSDEEEGMDSQSYDIQMDQGMGFIRRSNTAQKLEKMNAARNRASKIKNVKLEEPQANSVATAPGCVLDFNSLFVKKQVKQNDQTRISLLGEKLTKYPKQPQNKFLNYARFDGTAQSSVPTKTIKIFLTMLPEQRRNYPMTVCVNATAKIQEFTGLICYKSSIANPMVPLLAVQYYGLYITEEDGEIDMDFPPLDIKEPCSKFCFSHLSLVERKPSDVKIDMKALSITSKSEQIREELIKESNALSLQQAEDLARMQEHNTMMEAPLYRSYLLQLLSKGVFRSDIQLGLSGEKLELDPVANSKFWRQKAISHSMDSVVACEIYEETSSRAFLRITYGQKMESQQQQQPGSPTGPLLSSSISNDPPIVFRDYEFITDKHTAQDIVKKIVTIIEVRSSDERRVYGKSRDVGAITVGSPEKMTSSPTTLSLPLTLDKKKKSNKKKLNFK